MIVDVAVLRKELSAKELPGDLNPIHSGLEAVARAGLGGQAINQERSA